MFCFLWEEGCGKPVSASTITKLPSYGLPDAECSDCCSLSPRALPPEETASSAPGTACDKMETQSFGNDKCSGSKNYCVYKTVRTYWEPPRATDCGNKDDSA